MTTILALDEMRPPAPRRAADNSPTTEKAAFAQQYHYTPTPTWRNTRGRSTPTLCAVLTSPIDGLAGQGRQQGVRTRRAREVREAKNGSGRGHPAGHSLHTRQTELSSPSAAVSRLQAGRLAMNAWPYTSNARALLSPCAPPNVSNAWPTATSVKPLSCSIFCQPARGSPPAIQAERLNASTAQAVCPPSRAASSRSARRRGAACQHARMLAPA
jgi:hypothetical protein